MLRRPLLLLTALAGAGLCACADDEPEAGAPADGAGLDATVRLDLAARDAQPAPDRAPPDLAPPDALAPDALLPDLGPPGGDRPAQVVPAEGEGPHPILLVLHGYQINHTLMLNNYPLHRSAPGRGVIVVAPDGTTDERGARFWDAEHCCPEREVDDVGYLLGLLDEVVARYDGDPSRIYVFGHSNGGYMAHHLACVAADRFAGIFSVSGLGYPRERCQPARPLAVWQIHGTEDPDVPYAGREDQPGADALAEYWAAFNGCGAPQDRPAEDLVDPTPGDETVRTEWAGCPAGASVSRWRMEGVRHIVFPNAAFLAHIVDAVAGAR